MLYRALREAANIAAKYDIQTDHISYFQGEIYLHISLKQFERTFFVRPYVEGNQRVYMKRFHKVNITASETIETEAECEICAGLGFTLRIDGLKADCESCDTEWAELW